MLKPFYGHLHVYAYIIFSFFFTFDISYLSCINYCLSHESAWLGVTNCFMFNAMEAIIINNLLTKCLTACMLDDLI